METKFGFLNLITQSGSRPLHYVIMDDKYVLITLSGDKKVADLTVDSHAKIELLTKPFGDVVETVETDFEIITDEAKVKEVYEFFTELNHNHFKEFDTEMVILMSK